MGVPVLLFPSLQKGPPAGQIANFFTIILKIGSMTSTFPELSNGIWHAYVHWSTLQSLKVTVVVSENNQIEQCVLGGKARKNWDIASSTLKGLNFRPLQSFIQNSCSIIGLVVISEFLHVNYNESSACKKLAKSTMQFKRTKFQAFAQLHLKCMLHHLLGGQEF